MNPVVQGIHLEPTNICTLKCPGCPRTRFINQWPKNWKNHSIDTHALLRFLDIELSGVKISLCGNYGDPIYHPDLAGLVRGLKNRGAAISIVTNGGHRHRHCYGQPCGPSCRDAQQANRARQRTAAAVAVAGTATGTAAARELCLHLAHHGDLRTAVGVG